MSEQFQDSQIDPFSLPPTVQEWGPPSIEAVVKLDTHAYLEGQLSDEVLQTELADIQTQLATEPEMQHQVAIQNAIDEKYKELRLSDDFNVGKKISDEIDSLNNEASQDWRTYSRYRSLRNKMSEIESYHKRSIDVESPEAQLLLNSIFTAAGNQVASSESEPPFANFADNTKEAWSYVPDAAIRDYLKSKLFLDTDSVDYGKNRLEITSPGKPFELPTDIFVSAAGFESWQGREGHGSGKTWSSEYGHNAGTSIDAIKHYASLPSELPSVGWANIYVQPDGKVFADNSSGDSHRLAAAMLRGQETTKVDHIYIIPVDRNYI